jgi:hypothetical protein
LKLRITVIIFFGIYFFRRMYDPNFPKAGGGNPEKRENLREIQVNFSVNGGNISGSDASNGLSKIIFIENYDSKDPARWRGGPLPLNGERWKCVIVRDTMPQDPRQGAIIVRLEKNTEEIDFSVAPTGRVLFGAEEFEVVVTVDDPGRPGKKKIVLSSDYEFEKKYKQKMPHELLRVVQQRNQEWITAEALLHKKILAACEEKDIGFMGESGLSDLPGICKVRTEIVGNLMTRVVAYTDEKNKDYYTMVVDKPVTAAIECREGGSGGYKSYSFHVKDIAEAVSDLGNPSNVKIMGHEAMLKWPKYFPRATDNTSSSKGNDLGNNVYMPSQELFEKCNHHLDGGVQTDKDGLYGSIKFDMCDEPSTLRLGVFERQDFGTSQSFDFGFTGGTIRISGFNISPADFYHAENLPIQYKKAAAVVLKQTIKPLQEHTAECRRKCLDTFGSNLLKDVESLESIYAQNGDVSVFIERKNVSSYIEGTYDEGSWVDGVESYVCVTFSDAVTGQDRKIQGRLLGHFDTKQGTDAEEMQRMIEFFSKKISSETEQLKKIYSQTAQYEKQPDPLIYGDLPEESEASRAMLAKADAEFSAIISRAERIENIAAEKVTSMVQQFVDAQQKHAGEKMYREKHPYIESCLLRKTTFEKNKTLLREKIQTVSKDGLLYNQIQIVLKRFSEVDGDALYHSHSYERLSECTLEVIKSINNRFEALLAISEPLLDASLQGKGEKTATEFPVPFPDLQQTSTEYVYRAKLQNFLDNLKAHPAYHALSSDVQAKFEKVIYTKVGAPLADADELEKAWAQAVELQSQEQKGEILVNWGGNFKLSGNGSRLYWVVMPDGSLREADETKFVGRYNDEGTKKWLLVAPDEVALAWGKSYTAAPHNFVVNKLPTGETCTAEQLATIHRIEAELAVKWDGQTGMSGSTSSPPVGNGWGIGNGGRVVMPASHAVMPVVQPQVYQEYEQRFIPQNKPAFTKPVEVAPSVVEFTPEVIEKTREKFNGIDASARGVGLLLNQLVRAGIPECGPVVKKLDSFLADMKIVAHIMDNDITQQKYDKATDMIRRFDALEDKICSLAVQDRSMIANFADAVTRSRIIATDIEVVLAQKQQSVFEERVLKLVAKHKRVLTDDEIGDLLIEVS